ncbi:hypothetical protein [Streptomyces vilmorinianum]|uniref:hypothetical protein n=1 Tax=Streptomyces vilmorinianum TaxID=3051092 RepID=UPI0010FB568F|nr:hypothetical protein [Streptomyces vilmorinianum]
MNAFGTGPVSRRGLIRLGGGAVAGLVLGGVTASTAQARIAAEEAAVTALPGSKAFDLSDPSDALFMHKQAWCPTVMQCAGYDHLNKHWYVAQVMYNPGDGVSYATRKLEGDIAITKLSEDGSTKLGRMYLRGFGHGAQIGIETTAKGSAPYIWIEYDSEPNAEGTTGFGTKVCRIKYVGPAADAPPRSFHWDVAADRTAMDFKDRTPDPLKLPGAGSTLTAPRAVVDMHHRRLLVRFNRNGQLQCAVWDLDTAAAAPLGAPLHHFANLPRPVYDAQGFCLYGSYMYMLEGEAYASGGPTDTTDVGTTHITRVDLNTGVSERALTRALKSLVYREPEGMNIMLVPDPANAGGYLPRLTFGFASGVSGDRRVNIAYKNALI